MNTFTEVLTSGSITFNAEDGAQSVSVQCSSAGGSCTVIGNFPFKGRTPSALVFGAGEGITLTNSANSAVPLNGVVITWVSGSVNVVVSVS